MEFKQEAVTLSTIRKKVIRGKNQARRDQQVVVPLLSVIFYFFSYSSWCFLFLFGRREKCIYTESCNYTQGTQDDGGIVAIRDLDLGWHLQYITPNLHSFSFLHK